MAVLFTAPPLLPACANRRFGQVSLGTDENQRSDTPKLRASVLSTGSCSGVKQCMADRGSNGVLFAGWRM